MKTYGLLPERWDEVELMSLASVLTDGAHSSPKPQNQGRFMCSVKDMTYNKFDFSNSKLISEEDYQFLLKQGCAPQKGDLLISKDGANCLDLLFLYKQEEDIVLLSSIAIVRLKDNVCKEYVRYFLLSPDCQFIMRNNYVSGSAIPRVVLKDFKKVPIVLPPLPEQKAIASVLSSLDDKIDLLHRQNNTLEAMAETLFRQWFIEEAEEDWKSTKVLDIFSLVGGGTPKTSESAYWDGDLPWLSGGDIANAHQGFILSTEKSITKLGLDKSSTKLLPKLASVISARGTVGKYAMLSKPMAFSQSNYGIVPKGHDHYYFVYLLLAYIVDELAAAAYGSVFDTITTRTFEGVEINLPSIEMISDFEVQIGPLFDKKLNNIEQIRTLEQLRNTLLPKLMSGEVRVNLSH